MTLETATQTTLQELLAQKKARNPSFSLRALARQLDVSHTYLSLVMAGKKRPSFGFVQKLAEKSGIDPQTLLSLENGFDRVDNYERLQIDQFRLLSDWYHVALLDLVSTDGFRPQPIWIAQRLGISVPEVKTAIGRLKRLGLLEIQKDGAWKKTKRMLLVPTARSHAFVRNFHEAMIQKALETLQENADFSKRSITGTTMAINPNQIEAAKKKIAKFEHNLLKFLTRGRCTEVYQLNVQLFQLSRKEVEKGSTQ